MINFLSVVHPIVLTYSFRPDGDRAYKHYITSLKRSPAYAPAFTSLGIYYLDGADPPDPKRAAKCFQKAFELDAREVDAAQRLAHSFAEEREWDLVEVVAKRTIEGEGGLGGGLSAEGTEPHSTTVIKHSPTNAWAWKAVGVVQLVSRFKSIFEKQQLTYSSNP